MAYKDKEKRREYQRRWRAANPQKAKEDPRKVKERNRRYYVENKDRILEEQKAYREANKGKIAKQQKEYRENNKPAISARNRLKKYGITAEEFDSLVVEQNGRCAICEDILDVDGYRKIHVDHCHVTNKVRSILCSGCNVGLGHFRESPEILHRAAIYAERCSIIADNDNNQPSESESAA